MLTKKKEMIRSKLMRSGKSEKQEPKSEEPEKLDREKEQRKSIQSQLEKENKQIVNQIEEEFQRNSPASIESKLTVSNKITNKSPSISIDNSSKNQVRMYKLSKQDQENVQTLYKRALNQRQERLERISRSRED
jgi:hypothetical protein